MNPQSNSFQAGYSQLEVAQRAAVDWRDGPLLVLAGPGSGKTHVLTLRMAKLLLESPESSFRLLALTFTNKAADEMLQRLLLLVPEADSRCFVGTYHGFAADVLRQHGIHVGVPSDFRLYSLMEDRRELLRTAIQRDGRFDQGRDLEALETIDYLKSRLIPPNDTARRFGNYQQGEKVATLYGLYEAQLKESSALDFNSLIFKTRELFKSFPAIASSLRQTYRYWLLDEFQDTTGAQYALLLDLAQRQFANLFVVADDDQILYQWNGASYEYLQRLRADFSPQTLQLPTNFRCPAEIVTRANALITHNTVRTEGKKPLLFGRRSLPKTDEPAVRLLEFDTDDSEAQGIAVDITERHQNRLSQVAILARTKTVLDKIQKAFREKGVSAILSQRRDRFASAQFQLIQSCLNLAKHRQDAREVTRLLSAIGSLTNVAVEFENVRLRSTQERSDLLSALLKELSAQPLDSSLLSMIKRLERLSGDTIDFRSWLADALEWASRTEAAETAIPTDYSEDRAAWIELQQEIRRSVGDDVGLEHFLQELESRSKQPPITPGSVVLMTIHGAKGKEFDFVYLVGMAEDILPSFQAKRDTRPDAIEEERRNCFVAITRTQEALTLSRAAVYRGFRKQPSRFLAEMGFSTAS